MKKKIAENSAKQGFFRSRLPEFSPEEVKFIKGSSDFLALNHYTTSVVFRNESTQELYESPSYYGDVNILTYLDSNMPASASSWLRVS